MKTQAGLAASEFQIRRGETAAARQRIDAMLLELERRPATQVTKMYVATCKNLKGGSFLQDGHPDAALPWLEQARDDMVALYGRQHPASAMMVANSALAFGALGRFREANEAIDEAQPVLKQAMGPSAPNYRRVEQWRTQLRKAAREGSAFEFKSEFLN
jgi:hypothetical protein